MPLLVVPTTTVMASFLEAMDEFAADGPAQSQTTGWIEQHAGTWRSREGFEAFVRGLCAEEVEPSVLPEHWVLTSTRWWIEGDQYLGRIAVRHHLNDFLRDVGGHIGYDVRPSARGQGHATAMLRAVLPLARAMGITSALVTCDWDNAASIRVIESAGGVLEDRRGDKLRYWVRTG